MNQADMNQQIRESLSAGIDGELSKEQLRFLLSRLGHDAPLQQAWQRYHLARDGVRGQLPPMASAGFAARVMAAIEQEALPMATTRRGHWLRWSAGGAIAASVAAAALMIAQPAGDPERLTASTVHHPSTAVASAQPTTRPTAPAAVPPWLSGNSAGLLSQQASATLGAPFDGNRAAYPRHLSAYPSMQRYRTLDNNDGSYLLLLDPQQGAPGTSRQAAAGVH
jgi:sigma-E factor negative regulatory protein RseA